MTTFWKYACNMFSLDVFFLFFRGAPRPTIITIEAAATAIAKAMGLALEPLHNEEHHQQQRHKRHLALAITKSALVATIT